MQWKLEKKYCELPGFSFNGINVGIKNSKLDLGLVVCCKPVVAAKLFTKNNFLGAPLIVAKQKVFNRRNPKLQAVIVNSKNANVFTGTRGEKDVKQIVQALCTQLKLKFHQVMMSSTGVIGKPLPTKKIMAGLDKLNLGLATDESAQQRFSQAIMTTDNVQKYALATLKATPKDKNAKNKGIKILGIAKGAGMLEPNMATMLVYLFTDAKLKLSKNSASGFQKALRHAVDDSFHCLTIDGDTSTSDTVLLLSDESAELAITVKQFQKGLSQVCIELAKQIARDGEGGHSTIHLTISGAKSKMQADLFAKSVLNSLLVKTAFHGADPNWGRIVMAIGKVERYPVDKTLFFVSFYPSLPYLEDGLNDGSNDGPAVCQGVKLHWKNFDDEASIKKAEKLMQNKDIYCEIGVGKGSIRRNYWGVALGEDYVRFNSAYTT